jgi:hypothetical protein
MKYYKDASNNVFAFELDGSQDRAIPKSLIKIDQAEADAIREQKRLSLIDPVQAAKAALLDIDLASIRALREYIASKADAPQVIKEREAAAVAERVKIK